MRKYGVGRQKSITWHTQEADNLLHQASVPGCKTENMNGNLELSGC